MLREEPVKFFRLQKSPELTNLGSLMQIRSIGFQEPHSTSFGPERSETGHYRPSDNPSLLSV